MLTLKQLDKTFGAGTASAHHALCGIDLKQRKIAVLSVQNYPFAVCPLK